LILNFFNRLDEASSSIETILFDWKDYNSSLLHSQEISCLFAADCTYSEDLNLSLIAVFEDYLVNNPLSKERTLSLEGDNESSPSFFLPLILLEKNIPFVLIACTVRNEETFSHFCFHLSKSSILRFHDLSEEIRENRSEEAFPYFPSFSYDSSTPDIRVFCIFRKE
jgi:hypothetical protein